MPNEDRRCATCKYLKVCKEAQQKLLRDEKDCSLWAENEQLAIDAREELEIEFGPQVIDCLTLQKTRVKKRQQRQRKGVRTHVKRRS